MASCVVQRDNKRAQRSLSASASDGIVTEEGRGHVCTRLWQYCLSRSMDQTNQSKYILIVSFPYRSFDFFNRSFLFDTTMTVSTPSFIFPSFNTSMFGDQQTSQQMSYQSNGQWQFGTGTDRPQSNTGPGYGNYVRLKGSSLIGILLTAYSHPIYQR